LVGLSVRRRRRRRSELEERMGLVVASNLVHRPRCSLPDQAYHSFRDLRTGFEVAEVVRTRS